MNVQVFLKNTRKGHFSLSRLLKKEWMQLKQDEELRAIILCVKEKANI